MGKIYEIVSSIVCKKIFCYEWFGVSVFKIENKFFKVNFFNFLFFIFATMSLFVDATQHGTIALNPPMEIVNVNTIATQPSSELSSEFSSASDRSETKTPVLFEIDLDEKLGRLSAPPDVTQEELRMMQTQLNVHQRYFDWLSYWCCCCTC